MERTTRSHPVRRHLVFDGVESILSKKGREHAARVRVWRGMDLDAKGRPVAAVSAVVLVSQLPGGTPPSWMTTKMANFCYQTLCGMSHEGMLFFEADEHGNLVQQFFEFIGSGVRMFLYNPVDKRVTWATLEHLVGEKIEP